METIRRIYGDYTFIWFVLLFGIFATVRFAWLYQENYQIATVDRFENIARDRIEQIKIAVTSSRSALNAIVAFYESSADIDRAEFSTFSRQIMRDNDYLGYISWIPVVPAAERTAFESRARAFYPDYAIRELDSSDNMIPAAVRDVYYPVLHTNDANARFIGFDLASNPERLALLTRAGEQRGLAVSPGLKLLSDSTQQTVAVMFVAPVFTKSAANSAYERTAGFVATAVPLGRLLDAVLKNLSHEGVNILIHDLTDSESILYARSTRIEDIPQSVIVADYVAGGKLSRKEKVDVGGRTWQVTVQAANGYFQPTVRPETYIILVGGIAFTLLLSFYMRVRARENLRIAREVDDRTRELSRAKKQMEMILVSTSDGITGLDIDGKIAFANPRASSLLGYTRREMIGQEHHAFLHGRMENGDSYPSEDCPLNTAFLDRQPVTVADEVFWKKDGTSLPVEYTASPIIDGDEVTGTVVVFRDITERRLMQKQLEKMARYDQLTGLANRALFMEHLKSAMARATRTKKRVAVIYMDLNNFKPLNDTLGHAAGDVYLKTFADRVKSAVREYDTAARLGGDEFAVLLDNIAEQAECFAMLDRLLNMLSEPVDIAGHSFNMSASIGVAFYPDHGATPEILIEYADAAMYKAKKGKNPRYEIHTA